jgi:hypothetical protein
MAKAILLIAVCTQVVDVIENIASEQVSNRIDKRKVNNISTSDLLDAGVGHFTFACILAMNDARPFAFVMSAFFLTGQWRNARMLSYSP